MPTIVNAEPSTRSPLLVMDRLLRVCAPGVNDKVPKLPLPEKMRFEVEPPPIVPETTIKLLWISRVFEFPMLKDPFVSVRLPSTLVTPILLFVTPEELLISRFTFVGNPLPIRCSAPPL